MLGIRTTPTTAIASLLAELDEDVRAEIEQSRVRLADRLRAAGETTGYRIRNALEGLGMRWPATFDTAQFEAQYLPLFDALQTAFHDADALVHDWTQIGPSLTRQAADLAARIVNEHPVFTQGAVEPLRRYATLVAEAPCYAAAIPGLRDTIARLLSQWARTQPTASRNCQVYLGYVLARKQVTLTEVAARAAEAVSGRDQFVASIEATARAFASRYGITVKPVVVDRVTFTITTAKEV
ncbi:MAG: hypothetical protein HY574_09520 [candidate division NC10 bacterium]|nr:hypothetical protein [candidate division NC10 bacterium]